MIHNDYSIHGQQQKEFGELIHKLFMEKKTVWFLEYKHDAPQWLADPKYWFVDGKRWQRLTSDPLRAMQFEAEWEALAYKAGREHGFSDFSGLTYTMTISREEDLSMKFDEMSADDFSAVEHGEFDSC